MQRRLFSDFVVFASVCLFLWALESDAIGDDVLPPAPATQDSVDDSFDLGLGAADDLDALLELADEDFSQVSRVSVLAPGLNREVTTVTRQTSSVGKSPAAVYVITPEMIRRSGARSIPEALRLAPGVNVARVNSNNWAISIRGNNGRFSTKLLVQIDGRSVYTPLFGGTYWDVQDVVLEDIERIEVVRGPGASVWGSNAVNGIINILTKSAKDTQGLLVQSGFGTEERNFSTIRYGGQYDENTHYRLYGKWFERDSLYSPSGSADDDWRMGRTGFRIDSTPTCCDSWTVQGDYYDGTEGLYANYPSRIAVPTFAVPVVEDQQVGGANLLGRWTRQFSDDESITVRSYIDFTDRQHDLSGFREERTSFDLDFQHRIRINDVHDLNWGTAYRRTGDKITDGTLFEIDFTPQRRRLDFYSFFVQDTVTIVDETLDLIIGSKFENNEYTGWEIQPSARLLWTPSERYSAWASVSRAVRLPTRIERDQFALLTEPIQLTPFPVLGQLTNGNPRAEELTAFELGFRGQPNEKFWFDVAAFAYQFDNFISTVPTGAPILGVPVIQQVALANDGGLNTYGFDLAATYQCTEDWHNTFTYSFLTASDRNQLSAPRNTLLLQNSFELTDDCQFDLIWRYADNFTSPSISSYLELDARLAIQPTENLELALVGQNLLDSSHVEYIDNNVGTVASEVQRGVYFMLTWTR